MHVTITADDISSLEGHGSVGLLTGTGEDGERVTFAGEPRMIDDIAQTLLLDEDEDITVFVEDWQIMRVSR